MLAFGLCLALFAYFLLVGSAAVRPLYAVGGRPPDRLLAGGVRPGGSRAQALLLSPAVGLGVTVFPVFLLNRWAGTPVGTIGPAVVLIVALLAMAVHVLCRRGWLPDAFAAGDGAALDTTAIGGGESSADPRRRGLLGPRAVRWDAFAARPAFGPLVRTLIEALPILAVVVAGGVLVGFPLFGYGFDWLSFCNDDMANYTASADRFVRFGFTTPPTADLLLAGTDYPQTYWFLFVGNMSRSGVELLLATLLSVAQLTKGTTLTAHQGFMPLIVTFHMTTLAATSALVARPGRSRAVVVVAAALIAASAEFGFGVVYQLFAQAAGIGVLCANLALICRSFDGAGWNGLVRHGLLVGISVTAELLIYPELNPFLAAGFAIFVVVALARQFVVNYRLSRTLAGGAGFEVGLPESQAPGVVPAARESVGRADRGPLDPPLATEPTFRLWHALVVLGVGAVLSVGMLNFYMYEVMAFMLGQKGAALSRTDPTQTLFPFFMVPSGLSTFWGFLPIAARMPEPMLSTGIVVGALLSILTIALAVRLTWKGEPVAGGLLFCVLLAGLFFKGEAGFGLYKVAMYAQPFALGTLAVAWGTLRPRWRVATGLLVLLPLGAFNFQRLVDYGRYSEDRGGSTFNEVLGATQTGILRELKRQVADLPPADPAKPRHLIADSYNIVLCKLISVYTRGEPTAFPASRLQAQAAAPWPPTQLARPSITDFTNDIIYTCMKAHRAARFDLNPQNPGQQVAGWTYFDMGGRPSGRPDEDSAYLLAGTNTNSLFNGRASALAATTGAPPAKGKGAGRGQVGRNFSLRPLSDVHNHLIFIETNLSQAYYQAGDTSGISVYQFERDPMMFEGNLFAGIGRYFVFEVLRPDEKVRFAVNLTCSLNGDGENQLPPGSAVGAERATFGFVGRGSARVFSPPVKPQTVLGRTYVGLDMGVYGKRFLVPRTGAMRLFGQDVAMDRRQLVAFGRDVSLISEREFQNLQPPPGVTWWADDRCELRHPDLEYSGVYEDGWVSEHAFLALGQQKVRNRLIVKGEIPLIDKPDFSNTLKLLVDGKETPFRANQADRKVEGGKFVVGTFELEAEVPVGEGNRRKIEFVWSATQKLVAPDNRPTAARLTHIMLEPPVGVTVAANAAGTAGEAKK